MQYIPSAHINTIPSKSRTHFVDDDDEDNDDVTISL
jgi:hypothetical protein